MLGKVENIWTAIISFFLGDLRSRQHRQVVLDMFDDLNRSLNELGLHEDSKGYIRLRPGLYEKKILVSDIGNLVKNEKIKNNIYQFVNGHDKVTIMLFNYDVSLPRHRHAENEVIFCLEGEFEDQISGETCCEGEKMLIPANVSHTFRVIKPGMAIVVMDQSNNFSELKVVDI